MSGLNYRLTAAREEFFLSEGAFQTLRQGWRELRAHLPVTGWAQRRSRETCAHTSAPGPCLAPASVLHHQASVLHHQANIPLSHWDYTSYA